MNYKRYTDLLYLIKVNRLNMTDVARHAGCSPPNVHQFFTGLNNSKKVALALVRLTKNPARISKITGIPLEELDDQND